MALRKYFTKLYPRQLSLGSRVFSEKSNPQVRENNETGRPDSEVAAPRSQTGSADAQLQPEGDKSQLSTAKEESRLETRKKNYTVIRPSMGFGRLSSATLDEKPKLPQKWDEVSGTKTHVRQAKKKWDEIHFKTGLHRFLAKMQMFRRVLIYKNDYDEYMERRSYLNKIFSQEFIPARVYRLGPDLAAAHFIVYRGGSIRFWGHPDWVGRMEKNRSLPSINVPGYYVEAINAHGTDLHYEGLLNIRYLIKLKWLSLKGLENINNFALDLISGEYGSQLEYLDLSNCRGITYHGLSCFYRFKKLKVLNLSGIDHPVELKASCLLLQDLLPELEIIGVDFSIPESEGGPTVENVETPEKEIRQLSSA